jgi:hypothetical protein
MSTYDLKFISGTEYTDKHNSPWAKKRFPWQT